MRRAARRRASLRWRILCRPVCCRGQLCQQRIGKRLVSGELDRALALQIVLEVWGVDLGDAAAQPVDRVVGLPVAEKDDGLPLEFVANDAVAQAFGCLRCRHFDCLAELLQGRLLLLRCLGQVVVDGLHYALASTTQKRLPWGSARMT